MQWADFERQITHLPPSERKRVHEAFDLGAQVHEGQKRKSGEPYFTHPIEVALMLAKMGADEETLIVALLHDSVEDTPITIEDIGKRFGPSVQRLIDGLTKLTEEEFVERPTLNEQGETLRKMFKLMQEDIRIMVIKLADRLHNMQTIQYLPQERQASMAAETGEIYVRIASKLCMQDMRENLEALCLKITNPVMFDSITALRESLAKENPAIIETLQHGLADHLIGSKVRFISEFQPWEKQQLQVTAGTSGAGSIPRHTIALICETEDECYTLLGALHQRWPREVLSFQDFINTPVMNGYRGLHTTVIFENGTRVRCKIRTKHMQEYARRGITLYCFGENAEDHISHLPWMQRIAPLAEDTKDRSQEFWDSLQSDILGRSIVVYGTDNRSVSLPDRSTVLDAAFYLLQDEAFRIESIKVNGNVAPFHHEVQHGDTLEVTSGKEPTVKREWLAWAKTGLATALIRSKLAGKSEEERYELGRAMLQQAMHEKNLGFLDEFNGQELDKRSRALGYVSMHGALIALAGGHIEPEQTIRALFGKTTGKSRSQSFTMRYEANESNQQLSNRIQGIHIRFRGFMQEVRTRKSQPDGHISRTLFLRMSQEELENLKDELLAAGAEQIEVVTRTRREIILLAIVIILWSVNPVAAKYFLDQGETPLAMMTIRFLTFAAYTIGFFFVWRAFNRKHLVPLRHATRLALLPTIANAGMSLYFFALPSVPPSVHLTILRFNPLLLPFFGKGNAMERKRTRFGQLLTLMIASLALIYVIVHPSILGLSLSVATMLCYSFYSLTTERTLQTYKIDLRYPYILLHMGILSAIAGLALMLFQPPAVLLNAHTFWIVLYVLVCICFSHTAYSALLKTAHFKHFTDLLLLEVPLAVLLEVTLLDHRMPLLAYAVLGVILVALVFLRSRSLGLALK